MNNLVDLRHLEFSYPHKSPIIAIEDFKMMAGERLFLYGPSGCGKSTLLNLIAGTLVAKQGVVEVCQKDMTSLNASGRDRHRGGHLGYIFQSFNLIPYLSVKENVVMPAMVSKEKGSMSSVHEQADQLIAALGLEQYADQSAASLSVGQRQRVAAARALIGNPSLIIADEPTSSLDEANTNAFMNLLLEQAQKRNLGLLFVSHDRRLERHFERSLELPSINQVGRL